ncbi:hypothetical protein [Rhodoferax sp.]|uniref:hypothetical protein n=1 Tax=Rhodoferax sp. TaxID=50421 RepID=UPI002773FF48|nr:hypothetical protein [Rhodoferax sp.]
MKSVALACLAALASGLVMAQTLDRDKAFKEGKAYKSATPAIGAAIPTTPLETTVPTYKSTTAGTLTPLYGKDVIGPGKDKVVDCSTYVPGTDDYANQECNAINFSVKNPSARPVVVIDPKTDPVVTSGEMIAKSPMPYTAGMGGLAGTYTACSSVTTTTPGIYDTERCQVGREVQEQSCSVHLVLTYTWALYVGQSGAETKYGVCPAPWVRGDKIVVVPPKTPDAPATVESCFDADLKFKSKTTVPVFTDSLDSSACAWLDADGAILK